jgi:AraC-like DNA-binding protein
MEEVCLERYLSQPVGRYYRGPTFVVWWKSSQLNGIVLWGRPEEEHIACITRALDAELSPSVVPHASLIDARQVWQVDAAAFDALLTYVAARRDAFGRLITRQAVLRPEGFAGAAIAGFYRVLTPSFGVEVFTDPAAALFWLGAPGERWLCDELEALVDQGRGASAAVTALRAYLERSLGSASIACASDALRVSTRTLQRQLQEAGTSFRIELNRARIRRAKGLILDSELDLKQVAQSVGCGSPQTFSSLFRRVEGQAPSDFRAQDTASKRASSRRTTRPIDGHPCRAECGAMTCSEAAARRETGLSSCTDPSSVVSSE